jgi:hypothetical protein
LQVNINTDTYEWLENTEKVKENWELRKNILTKLGTAEYSEKALSKEFGHRKKSGKEKGELDQSKVHKELKYLANEKLIQFTRKKFSEGRGRPKLILGLTEEGLHNLVKILEPEQFWKVIFYVYDKSILHGEIKLKIEDIIKHYEKTRLKISRENTVPETYLRKLNEFKYKNISEDDFYSKIYEILEHIGKHGKIKIQELPYEFTHTNFMKTHERYRRITTLFLEMEEQVLIIRSYEKNKEYVQLTQFGLLILIYFVHTNFIRSRNNENEKYLEEEFNIKIETIISNNYSLLPIIFGNWPLIKKVISINQLVAMIIQIFFKTDLENLIPDYRQEESTILSIFESLQAVNQNKLRKEFITALQICDEWKKNTECQIPIIEDETYFGHINYDIIRFLEIPEKIFNKNTLEIQELKVEFEEILSIRKILQELVKLDKMTFSPEFSYSIKFDEKFEERKDIKALANRITFYFFTIFRAWYPQKFNELIFLDEKKEILTWYKNGINELAEFQETQIKILKNGKGYAEGIQISNTEESYSGSKYMRLQKLSEKVYQAKYKLRYFGDSD